MESEIARSIRFSWESLILMLVNFCFTRTNPFFSILFFLQIVAITSYYYTERSIMFYYKMAVTKNH